ncbi:MAG: PilZ domain-containing protein [Nitrospirota bacterium]
MGTQRDRKAARYTKRLEVKFTTEDAISYTGILSNLSENGLFIRTNRGYAPGTTLKIELVLPDGNKSFLRGVVRRTIKTPISIKNGMGIELTEKDAAYINFAKSFTGEIKPDAEKITPPEFQIISCTNCGVKNKVLTEKLSLGPKCGKCGTSLAINMP